MSDEIPFHIQEEIMKRLPVKSLIQFRSVSKAWKSLIESPQFIAAHSLRRHTQPQHLLLSFNTPQDHTNYLCFIDDETLFQQQMPVPNSPPYVKEHGLANIVGISHGLVCLYRPNTMVTSIWNPSIRNSIVVALPKYAGQRFVGFGVCPVTTDPKIVVITQPSDNSNEKTSYQCEVRVYTVSAGEWRSLSRNLPTKPLRTWWEVVAVKGFIYWLGGLPGDTTIISFDVTYESFQMIDLPDTLARHDDPWVLHIGKLRESLAILQYDRNDSCTIWMMEGGGLQRSVAKLFTIHAPLNTLIGFSKSGVPILLVAKHEQGELVVYEPNSEHNNVLQFSGHPLWFTLNSYTETLLLLGRFDCSRY